MVPHTQKHLRRFLV